MAPGLLPSGSETREYASRSKHPLAPRWGAGGPKTGRVPWSCRRRGQQLSSRSLRAPSITRLMHRERSSLERAVRAVSEQASTANALVREALDALGDSHPVTLHAKVLRLELLNVKADLERELGQLVLDCSSCGRTVHWVAGLGVTPGHWAHREPAPRTHSLGLKRRKDSLQETALKRVPLRVLESDDALRSDMIRQFHGLATQAWWKSFRISRRTRVIEELRRTLLPEDREDS